MNITILAGSNHGQATSTQLLRHVAAELQDWDVNVTLIDLWSQPLPFYAPDTQETHPHVLRLLEAVERADGLIIGTPEYHGSISGVLKNALDYLSGSIVSGKPVLAASSSGGPVGVSSLKHIQDIVRNLHGINSPEWISIGGGAKSFAPDGSPADAGTRLRVERALAVFMNLVAALRPESVKAG